MRVLGWKFAVAGCLTKMKQKEAVTGSSIHEGSSSVYWMVHIVRALLAHSGAGGDTLSACLAFVFTASACRHHLGGSLCVLSRFGASSGAFA